MDALFLQVLPIQDTQFKFRGLVYLGSSILWLVKCHWLKIKLTQIRPFTSFNSLSAFLSLIILLKLFIDKYISQPGYSNFKQTQTTSQHNTFEITFKTIDATGMLLYAQSVEKNDFLTIELVRGKIR